MLPEGQSFGCLVSVCVRAEGGGCQWPLVYECAVFWTMSLWAPLPVDSSVPRPGFQSPIQLLFPILGCWGMRKESKKARGAKYLNKILRDHNLYLSHMGLLCMVFYIQREKSIFLISQETDTSFQQIHIIPSS